MSQDAEMDKKFTLLKYKNSRYGSSSNEFIIMLESLLYSFIISSYIKFHFMSKYVFARQNNLHFQYSKYLTILNERTILIENGIKCNNKNASVRIKQKCRLTLKQRKSQLTKR